MKHSPPDQKALVGIFRNWNENWNENKMSLSCNVFIAIQIGFESHLSHHVVGNSVPGHVLFFEKPPDAKASGGCLHQCDYSNCS